jgi:hypothetical protein
MPASKRRFDGAVIPGASWPMPRHPGDRQGDEDGFEREPCAGDAKHEPGPVGNRYKS